MGSDVKQKGFSSILVIIAIVVAVAGAAGYFVWKARYNKTIKKDSSAQVNSFEECKNAGNPILESYPEQCSAKGQTFTNPDQKVDQQARGNTSNDDQAIVTAIQEDCALGGATDKEVVATIVRANMQDPNLYKKDVSFVRISAACEKDSGGFRIFLQKKDGNWIILGKSQVETLGCKVLDGSGIPASVATTCYEEGGVERPIK